jgi:hypothetical protein
MNCADHHGKASRRAQERCPAWWWDGWGLVLHFRLCTLVFMVSCLRGFRAENICILPRLWFCRRFWVPGAHVWERFMVELISHGEFAESFPGVLRWWCIKWLTPGFLLSVYHTNWAHVSDTLVLAGRLKVVLMVISQFAKAVCLLCSIAPMVSILYGIVITEEWVSFGDGGIHPRIIYHSCRCST